MALGQAQPGSVIASALMNNNTYNLWKGVAGFEDTVQLGNWVPGTFVLQPNQAVSSGGATELFQVKDGVGTRQFAITATGGIIVRGVATFAALAPFSVAQASIGALHVDPANANTNVETLIAATTFTGMGFNTMGMANIPQTFRHLRVVWTGFNDLGGFTRFRSQFSGITASYISDYVTFASATFGAGTPPYSEIGGTGAVIGWNGASTANQTQIGWGEFIIPNYTGSQAKSGLTRFQLFGNASFAGVGMNYAHGSFVIATQAAITSFCFMPLGGSANYVGGSSIAVYGIP